MAIFIRLAIFLLGVSSGLVISFNGGVPNVVSLFGLVMEFSVCKILIFKHCSKKTNT